MLIISVSHILDKVSVCEHLLKSDVDPLLRQSFVQVHHDTGKFSLCLKQSVCFSTDASLIHGYFLEEEKVIQLEYLLYLFFIFLGVYLRVFSVLHVSFLGICNLLDI